MKKVLIYTYKHKNYGAILQAYALQKYIYNNFPVDVKIVDFTTEEHLKSNNIIKRNGKYLEKVIISFFNIINYKKINLRNFRTELFKKKYIVQTQRYSTIDELINNNPIADIYISGSDQVFNPQSKYLPVYYLGFKKGNGIKVAYAPSFGISNFSQKITNHITPYLKDFDFISCRETIGAEYLSSILEYKVPTVCDPTLLLSSIEWSQISIEPNIESKYILVYEINGGNNIISLAKKIANITNLPIVCITGKTYKHYDVNKIVLDSGPSEFIGWIKNAEYVVTDSFHGTVFSWIYEKNFYYYLAYEPTSSRARSLLKSFECEDRIINKENIKTFKLTKNIFNKKDIILINNSKKYINDFINFKK